MIQRILKSICCKIFGHKYQVVQTFSTVVRRIKCIRCHQDLAMNDEMKSTLPWDSELENIYREQGYIISEPRWPYIGKKDCVSVEFVIQMDEFRHEVNKIPFEKIKWYKDGELLEIDAKIIKDFAMTGLNNVDFITSGEYLRKI